MDELGIMLSEISSTEKDKYCMLLLIHGILKKKINNLVNMTKKSRLTDRGLTMVTSDGGEAI